LNSSFSVIHVAEICYRTFSLASRLGRGERGLTAHFGFPLFRSNEKVLLFIPLGCFRADAFLPRQVEKHFCRICGSLVFNRNKRYPGVTIVPLDCHYSAENIPPIIRMFCGNMLPWVVFSRESLCYEKGITNSPGLFMKTFAATVHCAPSQAVLTPCASTC
jgi:hypothetical protein